MVTESTRSSVSSPLLRRRDARSLRLVAVAVTLALLVAATLLALPGAGLALFLVGLAVLFALPFAVVSGVASGLDPAR